MSSLLYSSRCTFCLLIRWLSLFYLVFLLSSITRCWGLYIWLLLSSGGGCVCYWSRFVFLVLWMAWGFCSWRISRCESSLLLHFDDCFFGLLQSFVSGDPPQLTQFAGLYFMWRNFWHLENGSSWLQILFTFTVTWQRRIYWNAFIFHFPSNSSFTYFSVVIFRTPLVTTLVVFSRPDVIRFKIFLWGLTKWFTSSIFALFQSLNYGITFYHVQLATMCPRQVR